MQHRAGRTARRALGWVATAVGVLAIVTLLGEPMGPVSTATRVVLGCGVLASVVLALVYVSARAWNRRSRSAGGPLPDVQRASTIQRTAGALLSRLESTADREDEVRRMLLTDRVQLTAAALADLDDRWEALAFIWAVRPSQGADFRDSTEFLHLPPWAQDAVVLLDLRRDLGLRGSWAAFTDAEGFYAHPTEHAIEAACRTGNLDLAGAITRAQQSIISQSEAGDDAPELATDVARVVDLLTDDSVWACVIRTD